MFALRTGWHTKIKFNGLAEFPRHSLSSDGDSYHPFPFVVTLIIILPLKIPEREFPFHPVARHDKRKSDRRVVNGPGVFREIGSTNLQNNLVIKDADSLTIDFDTVNKEISRFDNKQPVTCQYFGLQ